MKPCRGKLQDRGSVTGTIKGPDGAILYTIKGNVTSTVWATATPAAAAAAAESGYSMGSSTGGTSRATTPDVGVAAMEGVEMGGDTSQSGSTSGVTGGMEGVTGSGASQRQGMKNSSSTGSVSNGGYSTTAAAAGGGGASGVHPDGAGGMVVVGVPFVLCSRLEPPEDFMEQYGMTR